MTPAKQSHIYLIECQGYHKIGVSDWPGTRLTNLQIGCPFKLTLVAWAKFKDVFGTEGFLHKRYDKYLVRGEWFKFPPQELAGLLELFKDDEIPPTPPRPYMPEPIRAHWNSPITDYTPAPDHSDADPEYWSRL